MRLHLTLLLCGFLAAAGLSGCGNTDTPTTPPAQDSSSSSTHVAKGSEPGNAPAKATDADKSGKDEKSATAEKSANGEKSSADEKSPASEGKTVGVVIETSKGPIEAELYPDKAPISVKNFVSYVKKGHYNGTIFHRVIPNFMIQGGGFTPDLKEKPTDPPIKNEGGNGLQNKRGTLAMARTPAPDSATSQFFINVKDNDFLDRANSQDGVGYAVFGKVTKGMDVVDKIRSVPTTSKGHGMDDCPVDPVIIRSVKLK